VTGLAPGVVVKSAAVVTNGVWYELKAASGSLGASGAGEGILLDAGTLVDRGVWEPRPAIRTDYGYPSFETELGQTLDQSPGAALLLPGALERGDAMEGFLESGAWDAVYLHVTGVPPTVSLDTGAVTAEQAVYRIVIPRPARQRQDSQR